MAPLKEALFSWLSLWALFALSAGCHTPPVSPQGSKGEGSGARRFISLAPSLTEWVYELDAASGLVARSERCDQPVEALKKPSAGGLFPPDLELILSFKPSDALMIEGHPLLKSQLQRFGVQVHTLQPTSLKGLWALVERLGRLLERPEQAQRWLRAAQAKLSAELAELPPLSSAPKVLIEVWPSPLAVAGAESFMGDLVRVAGAQPVPSGLGAWPQLPLEELLKLDPELIIVSSPQRVAELLSPSAPRAWRALSAVKSKRVYAREGRLERPSPRLIEELIWLAQLLRRPTP